MGTSLRSSQRKKCRLARVIRAVAVSGACRQTQGHLSLYVRARTAPRQTKWDYFIPYRIRLESRTVPTGEQLRAARSLLRWERKDLALASKLSEPTIKRLEATRGAVNAHPVTIEALLRAFDAAGVELIEAVDGKGPGVRFKTDQPPV